MRKVDLKDVSTIMKEAFNSVDQGWSLKDSKIYIDEHQKCSFRLIAEKESKIVGFLIGDKDVDTLIIHSIGVLPEHMGKGIGKALWEGALKYARNSKLDNIRLVADPKSEAFMWYKRMGLKENGWVEMEAKL